MTPERVEWREFSGHGTPGELLVAFHKRACFTELSPSELRSHANYFGPFALEFEIEALRLLGAVPVFYVPVAAEFVGLAGIGAAVVARFADLQELLTRLNSLLAWSERIPGVAAEVNLRKREDGGLEFSVTGQEGGMVFPPELLARIKKDRPDFEVEVRPEGAPIGCNASGLLNLMRMLTWGIQSFEIQLGAIKAIAGLLYPTERPGIDEQLRYYRQREWRILGNMLRLGKAVSDLLNAEERKLLIDVDSEFFARKVMFPSGERELVDECQFLRAVDGRPIASYARRAICPADAVGLVREILVTEGMPTVPVEPLESL